MSARAATDEQAPQSTPAGQGPFDPSLAADAPAFASEAEAKAYWDGVTCGLRCAIGENRRDDDEPPAPRSEREAAAEILDPSHRRLREDGWLPAKKARFLLVLVAGGVVADACRAVGMSVTGAYALRNRRSGRAFAKMWDAILIHRARARLADNNLSRAMNGCVEQIVKDGVVVAERRRFDNRLSMAMLTRLDRLAESRTGEEAELLRALSEDFEDYLEMVESGGDEDAFVEARRPRPEAEPDAAQGEAVAAADAGDPPLRLPDARDWSNVEPADIPVDDLDPDGMFAWSADQRLRAERSHYLDWLDMIVAGGGELPCGADCPAAFDRDRRHVMAGITSDTEEEEEDEEEPLNSSPAFAGEDEKSWQPSTSSTSPAETKPAGPGGHKER